MLLLRAVAGSRLYGTDHADSDFDYYEIHDKTQHPRGKRQAIQSISNGIDTIKVGFSDWVMLMEKSHQALDAAFAPAEFCEVDLISDFRHSYYANAATVVPAFERVIKSFSYPDSTSKQKRHAIRLQFMINELLYTGRYNPRLSPLLREIVMNTNV